MIDFFRYWYYQLTLPWGRTEGFRWHSLDPEGKRKLLLWGWPKDEEVKEETND